MGLLQESCRLCFHGYNERTSRQGLRQKDRSTTNAMEGNNASLKTRFKDPIVSVIFKIAQAGAFCVLALSHIRHCMAKRRICL